MVLTEPLFSHFLFSKKKYSTYQIYTLSQKQSTMHPLTRKVHAFGILMSCVAVAILSVALASERSVFTVHSDFHGQLIKAGGALGFDERYGMGLVEDSLGNGWRSADNLLSVDGCDEHTMWGMRAMGAALAALVMVCMIGLLHIAGMMKETRCIRIPVVLLSIFSAVACVMALVCLTKLHHGEFTCTKEVEGVNEVAVSLPPRTVMLGEFFVRGFAFPVLCAVIALVSVSGLATLVSIVFCVRSSAEAKGFEKQAKDLTIVPSDGKDLDISQVDIEMSESTESPNQV